MAIRLPEKRGSRARLRLSSGVLLVFPAVLFLAVFIALPVLHLIFLSFHDYSPLRSADVDWVGLDNYTKTLGDPATYESLWITLSFTAISVAIELALAMLIAVLLARVTLEYRGPFGGILVRLFSGGFIVPFAIPSITAAVVWKMMLDPMIGPIDSILGMPIPWLVQYPLASIIVIDAWKTTPFLMFLLYAGIMSIEPQQFEAGKVDGVNAWQEFWYLTLPQIIPVVVITTVFRAVDAFTKAFDIIVATTGGGPGQETMVFPLHVWRTAFISLHFGEASALAVIALVISGGIGGALLMVSRRSAR